MTKETIGLLAVLGLSGAATASPIAPSFGGFEMEADIDVAAEMLAHAAHEAAEDTEKSFEPSSGFGPMKDPPSELTMLRSSEPVHGSGSFASLFGSAVSTQPVDTYFDPNDRPGATVIAIPLPAGAGLAGAGFGLMAVRRRR